MRAKNVTLYSLPYVVSIVGILAVTQQIASPLKLFGYRDAITNSETFYGQTVNRALKQDRLRIQRTTFTVPGKIQIKKLRVPTINKIVVEPATA